ncbi:MAG: hypothetical protein V7752_04285 [Halopseudomonas sp.]
MIDLSFTQDPQWIAQREELWAPVEKRLKKENRKKELLDIKQYFMTGVEGQVKKVSDHGKIRFFPLQNPKGWDYVIANQLKDPKSFKFIVDLIFQGSSEEFEPFDTVEKWDYFLDPVFEPILTSRVPMGRDGEKLTLELDPLETFCRVAQPLDDALRLGDGGDKPRWLLRSAYFFSLLPYITDECFAALERGEVDNVSSCAFFLNSIVPQIADYQPEEEFEADKEIRLQFLADFAAKLDELYPQLCPRLQQLWDDTKAEKAAQEAEG